MLKRLVTSLLLTFSVSAIISWFLYSFGISFLGSFLSLTVLQFIGFYFYSEYMRARFLIEEQKIIALTEAEFEKQGLEVSCPCDRNIKSFVPISLTERNEYMCPGCNKLVNVNVQCKTVLVTVPILNDPLQGDIKQ